MRRLGWLVVSFLIAGMSMAATTLYVTTDGTGDGSSWATPTNSIQGAIDAVDVGGTVWVSNGVYETGGVINWPAGSTLTNRVAIWKAITVRSFDSDRSKTIIKGAWDDSDPSHCGPAAVRCVFMGDGATLIGFTLTNGATQLYLDTDYFGGGVRCQYVAGATISNCWIVGNAAYYGGGVRYGSVYSSAIDNNTASGNGGGCSDSRLYNCTVSGNITPGYGGGMSGGSMVSNCVFVGNQGGLFGGAVYNATTYIKCTIVSNTAAGYGGGIAYGTLYNCLVAGNVGVNGGGTYDVSLYNCTVSGNTASSDGGGIKINAAKPVMNCIVYGNSSPGQINWAFFASAPVFSNSCTTPAQGGWDGSNTTNNPKFMAASAGNYRIGGISPCANTGLNGAWTTTYPVDLDGNPRILPAGGTVDMGAYEHSGAVDSAPPDPDPMTWAAVPSAVDRYTVTMTASTATDTGGVEYYFDCTTGGGHDSGWQESAAYTDTGLSRGTLYAYRVQARDLSANQNTNAYSTTEPATTPTGPTFYVTTNGTGDGSSWASPTNSIQGAIDTIADDPDSIVWVSNGVYDVGGVINWPSGSTLTNRVAITKAITVRSFDSDRTKTIIKGAWDGSDPSHCGPAAVRCVYMVNGAKLIGFTLTNGATQLSGDTFGGGVRCQSVNPGSVISNCWIVGNTADRGGGVYYGSLYESTIHTNTGGGGGGGGCYESRLYSCTVSDNRTSGYGGGLKGSSSTIASNCVFVGNQGALFGGASYGVSESCLFINCSIVSNTASGYGGGVAYGTLYNCLVSGNVGGQVGGVYAGPVYNCTIVGNTGNAAGGAVCGGEEVVNSIVYLNSPVNTGTTGGAPTLTNSCTTPALAGWDSSNTTNNPKFVSVGAGNYRIRKGSPCIDTGLNGAWTTTYPFDLDLLPRIVPDGDSVDMGAYEYVPPIPRSTLIVVR